MSNRFAGQQEGGRIARIPWVCSCAREVAIWEAWNRAPDGPPSTSLSLIVTKQYSTNGAGPSLDPTFWIGELPAGTCRFYAMGPVDQNSFDPDTLKQYESQSVEVEVSGSEPVFTTVRSITPGK